MLVFYLIGVGLSEPQIGMLLTLTLVGDTIVSLYLTTRADRIGRRRMLMIGASLMVAASSESVVTSRTNVRSILRVSIGNRFKWESDE